jgi:hypothetical protein
MRKLLQNQSRSKFKIEKHSKVTTPGSVVTNATKLSMVEPIDMIARLVTTSPSVRSVIARTPSIPIDSRKLRCQLTKGHPRTQTI